MLSRNPELHYVFARMEMAEERGLGLKSLRNQAERAGLPLPRYAWNDPYLVLTLFRTPESAISILAKDIVEDLNSDEKSVWQFATSKESFTVHDLIEKFGFDERKTQRILEKLTGVNLVQRVGKGRATRYEVIGK